MLTEDQIIGLRQDMQTLKETLTLQRRLIEEQGSIIDNQDISIQRQILRNSKQMEMVLELEAQAQNKKRIYHSDSGIASKMHSPEQKSTYYICIPLQLLLF